MLGRWYVPDQLLQPLERTWHDAESGAGQILSRTRDAAHLAELILDDDQRTIEQGGRTIRRLMAIHLVRGIEFMLMLRRTIADGVEAVMSDPLVVAGRSLSSQHLGQLALPERIVRERLRTEVVARFEYEYAGELPHWYAMVLVHTDEQALTFAFAPEGLEFVLGDTPAFTACTVDGKARVGLGPHRAPIGPETGVVMPLGPTICALLSPQDSAPITGEALVHRLNEMQSVRAVRTVVCSPDAPSEVVIRVKKRVTGRWGYGTDGTPNRPPDDDLPSVAAAAAGIGQPAIPTPPE